MVLPDALEPFNEGALDGLQDTDLCEDCEEVLSDYFCNVCQCSLCAQCWDSQPAHRRKRLAPGQIPHEKTELLLANRVQNVFSYAGDERIFERLHKEDEVTAWFGLDREMRDGRPFMFRDHGRFSELAMSSHSSRFRQRRPTNGSQDDTNCVPSLVSFVGQTGAGKSTLIKLLIQFNQGAGRDQNLPAPVPGITGRDIPTSEDVHLYADPLTKGSETPIFFADSEGLDGGEREPMAATLRKSRERRESVSLESESDYNPSRDYSEREILWMTSKTKRTRQFAASQLYPRILFGFSDVVVFVHRNPRSIEGVLERLLEWGSVAIETTYNQPILPSAIIALNATENDVDPRLWDVDTSTKLLFDSLAGVVDKNVQFSKYAEVWRSRGRRISSVSDLMSCYYSVVTVVRLPVNGRPKLVETQTRTLYMEIERGCRLARTVKAEASMLLSAFEFQVYLNHAFDHFCATIDAPFDFVKCAYLNTHLSSTFGESILTLAANMVNQEPRPKASAVFEKLGRFIASTIMLDTVRNNLKGTPERMFAQYIPEIDSALKEFCDRHWPCEFFTKGIVPPHLQEHLNNMAFQQSVRAAAVIMQCANVRSGHAAKGHQLPDGRLFAWGAYESSFSFENNRKQILDDIYLWYNSFMQTITQLSRQGHNRLDAAATIHRDDVLASHFPPTENSEKIGPSHSTFCICCLFGTPEVSLRCGHVLCKRCLVTYGKRNTATLVEMSECPVEINIHEFSEPRLVYLRPEAAGIRVLALTNGGIRSIIQLEVLKLIEKEFEGKIPIQSFFDMIIGEGTGGLIALGLVTLGWKLKDCEQNLNTLFARSYSSAHARKFPSLIKTSHPRYRSRALDENLVAMIGSEPRIADMPKTSHPIHQSTQASVLTSSATGRKVLFSSYRRKARSNLPYNLYPVTKSEEEPKVWEIARASMAHPDLFKPFTDARLGDLFFKKDMSENFLIEVARTECKAIYPGLQRDFPDVLLSLGSGRTKRSPTASIVSDETNSTKRTRGSIFSRNAGKSANESKSTLNDDSGEGYKHYPTPNFISINPVMDDLPDLDDVASIPGLQQLIQQQTDPDIITKLAAQLFATLFYAENIEPVLDTPAGEVLVPVRISCRLLDHTREIHEVCKLLISGRYRNSEFSFWEEGFAPQHFPMGTPLLDTMIREGRFKTLRVLIPIWGTDALVHGVLKLENGEEYPLSGFPRVVYSASKQSHKPTIRPGTESSNPTWSAPDVQEQPQLETPRRSNLPLRLQVPRNTPAVSPVSDERGEGGNEAPGPVRRKASLGPSRQPVVDELDDGITALPKYRVR